MDGLLFALTLAAALGCGLVAGFFFVFSTFVMRALVRLPPAQGAAAMQSINVTVVSFLPMLALFGTGLLCAVLAVWGLTALDEPYAGYLIGGGALYFVGNVVWTLVFHVPRNNALAKLEPTSPEAASYWEYYARSWTAGNHVRTVTALAAAGLLTAGLTV